MYLKTEYNGMYIYVSKMANKIVCKVLRSDFKGQIQVKKIVLHLKNDVKLFSSSTSMELISMTPGNEYWGEFILKLKNNLPLAQSAITLTTLHIVCNANTQMG